MIRNFIIIFLMLLYANVTAQTFSSKKHHYQLETILSGLAYPWSLEFLPNGKMLIAEKPGYLRLIKNGQSKTTEITGLPGIVVRGQGGLLDIAVDPDFEKNRTLFFSYSAAGHGGIGTEVLKARLAGNALVDKKVIFQLLPKTNTGYHFGSRLLFSGDGYLYITLGDRGDRSSAQNLAHHAGSMIRIYPDGSVPEDNPFINNKKAKPEIYTYGNRNIQGIAQHPDTGKIWTVEHGPQGGDELNLMVSGSNYGWPVITYGVNYVTGTKIGEGTAKEGMVQPIHYWVPSIAPSGLLFYTGDAFPGWRDNIFVSSLRFGQLVRLELKDNTVINEERLINNALGRIREVKQGPDGFLYIITDEPNGKLVRIKPAQ